MGDKAARIIHNSLHIQVFEEAVYWSWCDATWFSPGDCLKLSVTGCCIIQILQCVFFIVCYIFALTNIEELILFLYLGDYYCIQILITSFARILLSVPTIV